jgi:hypothetical protein
VASSATDKFALIVRAWGKGLKNPAAIAAVKDA